MSIERPDAPSQPTVKDSGRDFITIQWKAPSDDGGSPITGYEIERRDTRTNRWAPVVRDNNDKVCV